MRILLAVHNYYNDPITGAMHAVRTAMKWLAEAGNSCRALSTVRMDTGADLRPIEHLGKLGIELRKPGRGMRVVKKGGRVRRVPVDRKGAGAKPVLRYSVDGVDVTLLETRHNDVQEPDHEENRWFLDTLDRLIKEEPPDVLFGYGTHPVVPAAFKAARARGIATVVSLQNEGFELPGYFRDVDRVVTCSKFLSGLYRERIGLVSTPLAPALDWSQIEAPVESRGFVTFVNPLRRKGAAVFARVADILGATRPDIPMLVVQSAGSASMLNSVPGIDFTKYPQIMACPAVDTPGEFLALTKVLMAPSVWAEPFGRVAAEAMINGIPPLVSDRGGLPEAVGGDESQGGGGRVLPVPDWLDERSIKLVSEAEAAPWVEAICELWDDAGAYQRLSDRAKALAVELYSEQVLRPQYVEQFTSVTAGSCVLED